MLLSLGPKEVASHGHKLPSLGSATSDPNPGPGSPPSQAEGAELLLFKETGVVRDRIDQTSSRKVRLCFFLPKKSIL